MFHAELVAATALDPKFHGYAEQITGSNSATVVQNNKRPKSEYAYILSYFKAFNDPNSDTSDVVALLGLVHFVMLCATSEIDMASVTSTPHGLRCFSSPITRQGSVGVLFAGDGEQWRSAIQNSGVISPSSREWGQACHQQFASNNLGDLMGVSGNQYILEKH